MLYPPCCDEYEWERIACSYKWTHTHTLMQVYMRPVACASSRLAGLCEALCGGQWHRTALVFSFSFFLSVQWKRGAQRKCGAVGRSLSPYCKRMLALTLFAEQIRGLRLGRREREREREREIVWLELSLKHMHKHALDVNKNKPLSWCSSGRIAQFSALANWATTDWTSRTT